MSQQCPGLVQCILGPRQMTYSEFVGCWYNWYDLLALRTYPLIVAMGFAQSDDDLPASLFEAAYAEEEVAWQRYNQANAQRSIARTRRLLEPGPGGVVIRTERIMG